MRRSCVLAIDDEPAILKAVVRTLAEVGFHVVTASSCAAGKAELTSGRLFDVVLLDLQLQDGWGGELLPLVTGEPRPATIVVSAHVNADVALALSGRCDLVLPKPFSKETLIQAVWRCTHTGRLKSTVAGFCQLKGLSNQEQRILSATAEGLSNDEVADRLDVSPDTLRTYWQRIRAKTECDSRLAVLTALLRYSVDRQRGEG